MRRFTFNDKLAKLEKKQITDEKSEFITVKRILKLEEEVQNMNDSNLKRKFENKLAELNGRLSNRAKKAKREHIAEARRLKKLRKKR